MVCYSYVMNRSVIAFVVAPLSVPLVVSICWFVRDPGIGGVIATIIAVSAILTYTGTFAFGIPAFLFLRSRNLTAFWIAPITGFIIGATMSTIVTASYMVGLGGSLQDAINEIHEELTKSQSLLGWPGLLGTIVGVTLWLIARPDRKPDEITIIHPE